MKKAIPETRVIYENSGNTAFTTKDERPSRYIANCWVRVTDGSSAAVFRLTHLIISVRLRYDPAPLDHDRGDFAIEALPYEPLRALV